jgi:hypothetical protein
VYIYSIKRAGAASFFMREKIGGKSCHSHITSDIINLTAFIVFEVDHVVHTRVMTLLINTESFKKLLHTVNFVRQKF